MHAYASSSVADTSRRVRVGNDPSPATRAGSRTVSTPPACTTPGNRGPRGASYGRPAANVVPVLAPRASGAEHEHRQADSHKQSVTGSPLGGVAPPRPGCRRSRSGPGRRLVGTGVRVRPHSSAATVLRWLDCGSGHGRKGVPHAATYDCRRAMVEAGLAEMRRRACRDRGVGQLGAEVAGMLAHLRPCAGRCPRRGRAGSARGT